MLESLTQKVMGLDRAASKNSVGPSASKTTDTSSRSSKEKSFETVMKQGQGEDRRPVATETAAAKSPQTSPPASEQQSDPSNTAGSGQVENDSVATANVLGPETLSAEALVVQSVQLDSLSMDGEGEGDSSSASSTKDQRAQPESTDTASEDLSDLTAMIGVASNIPQLVKTGSENIKTMMGAAAPGSQQHSEGSSSVDETTAAIANAQQRATGRPYLEPVSGEMPRALPVKTEQLSPLGTLAATVSSTQNGVAQSSETPGQQDALSATTLKVGDLQSETNDADLATHAASSDPVAKALMEKAGGTVPGAEPVQQPAAESEADDSLREPEIHADLDESSIHAGGAKEASKEYSNAVGNGLETAFSDLVDGGIDAPNDVMTQSDADMDFPLTDVKSAETISARSEIAAHMKTELPRHIALQLADVARTHSSRPVELTLSPEELGRLRLTFSGDTSAMTVSVNVERPETLDLMRRHIDLLAQEMRDIGYGEVSFSFEQSGFGAEGSFAEQQSDRDFLMPQEEFASIPAPSETVARVNLSNPTGVDIRL